MEKIYHANTNQKKAKVAILISKRGDFKARTVIRDKEGNYIRIKGSILHKDVTNFNMYVPNNGVSNYVRRKLIKLQGEIDRSVTRVGDFNSLLSEVNTSKSPKISKDIFGHI